MTTHISPTSAFADLGTLEGDLDDLPCQLATPQALTAAIRGDIRGYPQPVERDLPTVDRWARRLNPGLNSACILIRQGEMGSVKIGRPRRVPVRAVGAFAAYLDEDGGVDL